MANAGDKLEAGILEFVYDFYTSMKAHEITLVYEGKVTHQITKAFIALAEAQMEHHEVECLQNISRHADDYESGESIYSGKGIFLLSNTSNAYCITTGNAIVVDKIPDLEKLLVHVNSLDTEDLKNLYMTQMKIGRISDKGGAGLGLIDIRKKTGEKLDFHFLPITDEVSFFLLSTLIPRT